MIRTVVATVHVAMIAALLLILGAAMSPSARGVGILGYAVMALCAVLADVMITWPLAGGTRAAVRVPLKLAVRRLRRRK
jgi:hypothetical protein